MCLCLPAEARGYASLTGPIKLNKGGNDIRNRALFARTKLQKTVAGRTDIESKNIQTA
jgi:hypothetical protein